jgi:hypothetical protein
VTAFLAEGRHEFDPDDEGGVRRLGEALAEAVGAGTGDVPILLSAVLGTAGMLGYVEWQGAGADRPDKPALSRPTLEGALLIHLHGTPDGPPARILQQEYGPQAR